jgi:putative spermidine/putrescine transport system ATP-binding protein
MASSGQTLHLDHVSKRYGDSLAVDDVSLRVAPGTFLTLLGPSGSGKTTLLMMIAGFVAPSSGSLSMDATPIGHLPPERRQFGMVFQGYALFPHLSVAENVAFPLKVRRWSRAEIRQRVSEALESVQLSAMADRMPRQLSGGQQQRVALARALVFHPHLLLLDEPLSALDKNLRTDMQSELSRLHRRIGLTFIYVTHDQQEALSMSDEIAILRDGRLVQHGTPQALYERPDSKFVAGFLGRSNFIEGVVAGGAGDCVTYRSGGQILQQAGPARTCVGDTLLLAIRPEKMRLLSPGEAAHNRLSGTISETAYRGDLLSIVADVPAIGLISVSLPTWRRERPHVGDPVEIGWDADAAMLVSDA